MNRKIRDSIDLKYFNTMKEWSHNFIRIRWLHSTYLVVVSKTDF